MCDRGYLEADMQQLIFWHEANDERMFWFFEALLRDHPWAAREAMLHVWEQTS